MAFILPSVTETADAAASTSTTSTLGIGQSAQGTISFSGDHDWYKVNLVAGQAALIGTGTNSLQNPFLRLLDSAGNILLSNDDGEPALSSSITFTAAAGGTYHLDAAAASTGVGQYGISASFGTKPSFDVPTGDGALDAFATWSGRGTGATITYGFRASPAPYTLAGRRGPTIRAPSIRLNAEAVAC